MARSQISVEGSEFKIVVHDFAGHPGQIQLSRELARRGYRVQHQYCQSVTTGQGATTVSPDDPKLFSVKGISLGCEFARYSFSQRILQEIRYGWLAVRAAFDARPNVVVYSNMPIIPLAIASLALTARGVPFVLWWQDVHSDAIGAHVRSRLGRFGAVVSWLFERAERGSVRRASAIVPITDLFADRLDDWRVDRGKSTVIPNWGALDEVDSRPRRNPWSAAHGLDDVKVIMYAGTLGLKHDPSVLGDLVRHVPEDCRVVVVSQGLGRQWLDKHYADDPRVLLLDYQPYEQLSDMLSTADILIAILENDASQYSVPSKVLNYMCAGRPVVALMPPDNAAAQMVVAADAGIVVPLGDRETLAAAVDLLLQDGRLRQRMSENARRYAEENFDITAIADGFENVLHRAVVDRAPQRVPAPHVHRPQT